MNHTTAALKIDELAYSLGNIANDDKRSIDSYTPAELVQEARYVLSLFIDPSEGHINGNAYAGDEGPQQRQWAQQQVRQLRAFIKQYPI